MKLKLLFSTVLLCAFVNAHSQCQTSTGPTNDCASYGDEIDSFVLNSVSASDAGCSTNGYNQFASPIWTMVIGGTYNYSASVGGGGYDEAFAAWIDLNNDGIFAANEQVINSFQAYTHSGSLTIPFGTATGSLSMRLRCVYDYSIDPTDACTSNLAGYGETEDYTVVINCPATNNALNVAISNTLVCLGGAASMTASGASTYTWSNGMTNGGSFTPTASANYTVLGSIAGCPSVTSSAVSTISVTSVPLPVTASSSPPTICLGSSSTLSAVGAANYTWMPGNVNTPSVNLSPSVTTIYTLTGFNTNGCPGTNTIVVTVQPTPTLSISASNSVVCEGNSVSLSVTGNASSYTWNPGGQTGLSISVSPTMTILYSVSGTNGFNCVSSANQPLIVMSNPVITAMSSNPVVCSNGTVMLSASGAVTYQWTGGAGNTSVTVTNPAATTVYTVSGTDASNCVGTATVEVDVVTPSISVSSNTSVCSGMAIVISASGADTYTWTNNGSSSQAISVTPNTSTTYSVMGTVTDPISGVSCDAGNMVQITVNDNPTIAATANHSVICLGTSAVLTASGAGSTGTYTWTGGSGAVQSDTYSVNPIANQTYSVTGTDNNGCTGKTSIIVQVSACTGIAGVLPNANLVIYPNPSNGEFTITADQNITLHVINELGQSVRTVTLDDSTREIKINNLSNGIYFITGSNANGTVKEKVVIAK